jgi:hypothetical protein
MTDLEVISGINSRLHEMYRVLDGRPIYRIVFSADQLEKRRGIFRDFAGDILLREVEEVREIRKYWYIQPPCWVLEKLIFVKGNQALKEITEEIVGAENGTYEPLFPFRDGNGNPLPVSQRVVDFILHQLHNPTKRMPSDVDAEKLATELEETKYFEEEIGQNQRSELFAFENSAFVSTNQLKFKKDKANGQS